MASASNCRWRRALVAAGLLVFAAVLRADPPTPAGATDRAAPASWGLWRCGPMPFPQTMSPLVPELAPDAIVPFARRGADVSIVVPAAAADSRDAAALAAMVRMIRDKLPRAEVVTPEAALAAGRDAQYIVLGALADNAFARRVLGEGAEAFLADIAAGGYRLAVKPAPFGRGRQAILALGADAHGAWPAAGILAYAIHPDNAKLTALHPWPVPMPAGAYWAPFEATYSPPAPDATARPDPSPAPAPPAVPFGVRIWGSPIPTLDSFARLVDALHALGVNAIVIQIGGWADVDDAPEVCRRAVDLAWRRGIFTILYVGNDMKAHRPAPLNDRLRAIVMAVKDHPGLLEWRLYNQLASDLSSTERRMVQDQLQWLSKISPKPIGVEVVWGHDQVKIPAAKQALIADLKRWGMTIVADDDAPVGGWSRQHDTSIWEPRLRELAAYGLPMAAVIQTHVPFIDPAIPSPAQVRSQFWWALAGGAREFFFETANLFTGNSMRGLLTWNLQPQPDGRYAAVKQLAADIAALAPVVQAERVSEADTAAFLRDWQLRGQHVAARLRRGTDGAWYLLLINRSVDEPAEVALGLRTANTAFTVESLAPAGATATLHAGDGLQWKLLPGDGACLCVRRLDPDHRPAE